MSGTDENLNVKITADIDGMKSKLAEGSTALDGFSKRADTIKKSFDSGKIGISEFQNQIQKTGQSYGVAAEQMAHGSAGITREIIVMGHEAVSGNFSRMPGSLMVLASRMGALNLMTLGVAGVIAGLSLEMLHLLNVSGQAAASLSTMEIQLNAIGQNKDAAKSLQLAASEIAKIPGVSNDAARETAAALSRIGGVSEETKVKINFMAADIAKALGLKVPEAAQKVAEALANTKGGADELQKMFGGALNASVISSAAQMAEFGNSAERAEAQLMLFDQVVNQVKGSAAKFAQESGEWTERWHNWGQAIKGAAVEFLNFQQLLGAGFVEPLKNKIKNSMDLDITNQSAKIKEVNAAQTAGNSIIERGRVIANSVNGEYQKRITLIAKIHDEEESIAQLKNRIKSSPTGGDDSDKKELKREEGALHELYQEKANLRSQDTQNKAGDLAAQRQLQEQDFGETERMIHAEHQLKQISSSQEFLTLKMAKDREAEEVMKLFDMQLALYSKDSMEYKKLQREKTQAATKFKNDVIDLNVQMEIKSQGEAQKMRAQWEGMFRSINRTFSQSITGMITGAKTLDNVMADVATNMMQNMISAILKIAEQKIAAAFIEKAVTEDTAQEEKSIYAILAFDKAYAWGAAWGGPVGGAISGALAFSAVEGFGSFEVGAWEIPKNMPAMLHQGETVLPKSFAESYRENAKVGSGGGEVHLHVHAIDAGGVKKFFSDNGKHVAAAVAQQVRSNSRGLAVRT